MTIVKGNDKIRLLGPVGVFLCAWLCVAAMLLMGAVRAPLLAPARPARQASATPPPAITPSVTQTAAATLTPTPTVRQACQDQPVSVKCAWRLWDEYGWGALLPIAGISLALLVLSLFEGVRSGVKSLGEQLVATARSRLRRGNPEREYLSWFITRYENPKFGPHSLARQDESRPPARLEEIYLPVEVAFEAKDGQRAEAKDLPGGAGGRPAGGERTVSLMEALKDSRLLVVIGAAGSGKSTLLQWTGLVCAHRLLGRRFKGQADLLQATGGPLFPILVPLEAFDGYCRKHNRQPGAAALQDFITESYREHCETRASQRLAQPLPADFFARRLHSGCLLLFDGMDEVLPERRAGVRQAVQEAATQAAHARTRILITARPSAQADAQPVGSRRGQVLPLEAARRDTLIRNLYQHAYRAQGEQRSSDLIRRLNASSEGVRRLAETPLMVTILTIIHRPGYELPYQRAEVYDQAVETLLRETHRRGADSAPAGVDTAQQRIRLALVAFQLHLAGRGEDGLPESDLIDAILPHVRCASKEVNARRAELRDFLYTVSRRNGLLDERDCSFAFRTHRSFQEFLAGWHLVKEYGNAQEQMRFIAQHLQDPAWEEPVRLAAGYLAIDGEKAPNEFVQKIAGLRGEAARRDYATALAGLCLVDLPAGRVRPELRDSLAPEMLAVLQRNPPALPLGLRERVGRALADLRDPLHPEACFDTRLHPAALPEMVRIPAGPFQMGTSAEEKALLEAQQAQAWDDEQPAHLVTISYDYQISRYPVTNREFAAFIGANGYDPGQPWWPAEGRRWRLGDWQPDLSIYTDETAQNVRRWLEKRPVEKRSRPFFWDDPAWNGPNQPVVGVTWFEAQAYAAWLSGVTGQPLRLPSEAEWEKAARFDPDAAGRADAPHYLWPWGDGWEPGRCNNQEAEEALGRTSPVGLYPHGASPLGCLDMAGNVWEWCLDWYDPQEYARRCAAGRPVIDPPGPPAGQARAVRGGAWDSKRRYARCAYRARVVPVNFGGDLGFRVLSPG